MLDRHKIGAVLIWLGVASWAPFLYMVATGQNPIIYPFMIIMTAALGGAKLRRQARLSAESQKRSKGRSHLIRHYLA